MDDSAVLLAILGMGAVTYATRLGGLLLLSRLRPTPRLNAWLQTLPGAVLVAIVAPTVLAAGPPGWLAALATLAVARRSGNALLAMLTGVAVVVVARMYWPPA